MKKIRQNRRAGWRWPIAAPKARRFWFESSELNFISHNLSCADAQMFYDCQAFLYGSVIFSMYVICFIDNGPGCITDSDLIEC